MTTGEETTANAPTGATPEGTITEPSKPEGTTHAFQADVARLLHLMVHSVYSERDIFLRELISNAADACEKLRYEAIAEPALTQDGQPFGITISIRQGRQDTGDRRQRHRHERAGPARRARYESPPPAPAPSSTVSPPPRARPRTMPRRTRSRPRRPPTSSASSASASIPPSWSPTRWRSTRAAPAPTSPTAGRRTARAPTRSRRCSSTTAPVRGTRVTLHLNAESQDYLEAYTLERIVREHSGRHRRADQLD